MKSIKKRIEDANFLWNGNRKESALLMVMIAVAALSRERYPSIKKDAESFKKTLSDFNIPIKNIEYKGNLEPIENIFYKYVRCNLIHESELPPDIQFLEEATPNSMSIRAGGSPEYILKLGTGWYQFFVNKIISAKELNAENYS